MSDSLKDVEKSDDIQVLARSESKSTDSEEAFGDREARRQLERRLLRKLDARMSILVVIYILNYVSIPYTERDCRNCANPVAG